jgi:hypothetical protein
MTSSDQYDERPAEDTSAEEYHASGDTESSETGTDYNPTTGEPEATPHDRVLAEGDAEAGNPNAASSAGLEGDLGISSERTGPADETGTSGLGDLEEFQGRTVGTAKGRTHGSTPTTTPSGTKDQGTEDVESNDAEVPSHELGNKNPGHSGA